MTLYIVGAGPGPGYQGRIVDQLVSSADRVYVETYTVPGSEWLVDYASGLAPGRVSEAPRSLLEEGARRLVEEASRSTVVVLVAGDPLVATTHRGLLYEAARAGVPYRVVPGLSGVCAAKSVSLLDYYKYGRTVTVPGPWRMVKAYSVVEYILSNACAGLHTLLLLDINPATGTQLPPNEAASTVLSLASELGAGAIAGAPAILVERAGLEGERVTLYRSLQDLASAGGPWREPASIAVPGPLGPVEREHLEAVHGFDPGPGLERGIACRLLSTVSEG